MAADFNLAGFLVSLVLETVPSCEYSSVCASNRRQVVASSCVRGVHADGDRRAQGCGDVVMRTVARFAPGPLGKDTKQFCGRSPA